MKYLVLFLIILSILSCDSDKSTSFELPETNWGPTELILERLTETSVKLKWKDNSDFEDGFIIDRNIGDSWPSDDSYTKGYHFTEPNDTTFVDTLIDWTWDIVNYRVKAFHNYNYSYDIRRSISIKNPVPSGLSVKLATEDKVNISWIDNCFYEDNYIVDKYKRGSGWREQFKILPANSTDYIDDEIDDKFGVYRVYCTYKSTKSDYVEAYTNLDSFLVEAFCFEEDVDNIFHNEDYVYITSRNKIRVLNIVDSNNLIDCGFVEVDDVGSYTKIRFKDDLAFVTNGSKFVVFDISDPSNPIEIFCKELDFSVRDFIVSDNYLYLVSGDFIHVMDIANPDTYEINSSTPNYCHNSLQGLIIAEKYLIISDGHLNFFDITDPAYPNYHTSNFNFYGETVSSFNNMIYVALSDRIEVLELSGSSISTLFMIGAPKYYKFVVNENMLFAIAGSKIDVYDISIPTSLTKIGSILPVSNDFVIMKDGLFTIRENKLYNCKLSK